MVRTDVCQTSTKKYSILSCVREKGEDDARHLQLSIYFLSISIKNIIKKIWEPINKDTFLVEKSNWGYTDTPPTIHYEIDCHDCRS